MGMRGLQSDWRARAWRRRKLRASVRHWRFMRDDTCAGAVGEGASCDMSFGWLRWSACALAGLGCRPGPGREAPGAGGRHRCLRQPARARAAAEGRQRCPRHGGGAARAGLRGDGGGERRQARLHPRLAEVPEPAGAGRHGGAVLRRPRRGDRRAQLPAAARRAQGGAGRGPGAGRGLDPLQRR